MTAHPGRLVLAAGAVVVLGPLATAQFDAYTWTLGVPSAPESFTTITGDTLLIHVNPPCDWSRGHYGWAETTVIEPGRFAFDLRAEATSCFPFFGWCKGSHVAVTVSKDPCQDFVPQPCITHYELFNGGEFFASDAEPIEASWSFDVEPGEYLRLWVNGPSLALDCRILAWFRNLTFTPALDASTQAISVTAGGAVDFALTAPKELEGAWYVLLGSASGTQPGLALGAVTLPLVWDAYTTLSLQGVGGLLSGGIGVLGPDGEASAVLALPPGLPGLAGVTLHHAYVVLDAVTLEPTYASQAVPLLFVP